MVALTLERNVWLVIGIVISIIILVFFSILGDILERSSRLASFFLLPLAPRISFAKKKGEMGTNIILVLIITVISVAVVALYLSGFFSEVPKIASSISTGVTSAFT